MIRALALCLSLTALVSCSHEETRPIAIIGARLVNPPDPPTQYSVIVVKDGVVTAIGPQQTVPVPPESEKINGLGKTVAASETGQRLAAGSAANLVVVDGDPGSGKVERRMLQGRWVANQ